MFSDPVYWRQSTESVTEGLPRQRNSFLIVTPFRNAERFISENARRSLCQLYDEYRIVFIDDASTDKSVALLEETIRQNATTRCKDVYVEKNATRQGCLANTHRAIVKHGQRDDVIVIVDGDDWLAHEDVLTIVNARYARDECWVMYGGAIWKPQDRQSHTSSSYTADEIADLRTPFLESWDLNCAKWKVHHLRTFRYALYQQIGALDSTWSCFKDGDGRFYQMAGDVAVMIPLIELAGERRIQHNRSKVYVYNLHEQNDCEVDPYEQGSISREIFAKPGFPRLESLEKVATSQSLPPAFVRPARATIGRNIHTSGWPFARQILEQVRLSPTVVLDDFVEQTFCHVESPPSYQQPWIGMFHHPPEVPAFTFPTHALSAMFQKPAWQESEEHLVGALTFSNYLADFLRTVLRVPVKALKVPVAEPKNLWCEEEFLAKPTWRLTQLGAYMRNTRAIHQVPPVEGYQRGRLLLTEWWTDAYDARVRKHWETNGQRPEYDGVVERGFVPEDEYKRVLTTEVVLSEVFAASANNVVVECIVHNTPLVINRHPAVVEYLGPEYPLFFDAISEVPGLLRQDCVVAAHRYLAALDKSELQGEFFGSAVEDALKEILADSDA